MRNLKIWLQGKAPKAVYQKTLGLTLAIFAGSLLIAILRYAPGFTMLEVQISGLGQIRGDPIGTMVFRVGFIVVGALLIPHALFVYRALMPTLSGLVRVVGMFLILSGVGIALVGIFPSDYDYTLHIVAAILAIGGIAAAALFLIPVLVVKARRGEPFGNGVILSLLYVQLLAVYLVTIFLAAVPAIVDLQDGVLDVTPVAWAPCEWAILFGSVVWLFGIFFLTREKAK